MSKQEQPPKPSNKLLSSLKNFEPKNKLKKVPETQKERKKTKSKILPLKYTKIDKNKEAKIVLIIDFQTNWYAQFKNACLADGTPLVVEQTLWSYIDLEASTFNSNNIRVELKANSNPLPYTSQCKDRIISPHFLLIRNFPTDIHNNDFKNLMMGFMFNNIPSMNNLLSIFIAMNRVLIYKELYRLNLPVVPMSYHPNFTPRLSYLLNKNNQIPYPKVTKVSSTHSGFGKIKSQDKESHQDVKSVLILNKDFYTEEPFINNIDFEFRIQKIGNNYRGFKRTSDNSWKNNWGNVKFDDYELEKKHIEWIDKASTIYGGLDICALDVLKLKNGNEVILELNGTACGLMEEHANEDSSHIRDLIIQKMSKIYCKN